MHDEVSYNKQTTGSRNPITRLAHSARYKIAMQKSLLFLPNNGSILDFGAGEGEFLTRLSGFRPDVELTAIEPYLIIKDSRIRRYGQMDDVPASSVDLITAFETLEHISNEEIERFLVSSRKVLKADGRIIITVPIMYGPVLPVKEVSRFLLHRRWSDISAAELCRATFGFPIERTEALRYSHKGFDFRALRREVSKHFTLIEEGFSPFRAAPWWLNSQAVMIAK